PRSSWARAGSRSARRAVSSPASRWRSSSPWRSRSRPGSLLRSPVPVEVEIGRGKKARQAYGFDDIAFVPSRRTRDPQDVDIGWKLGPHLLELPLLASAMDGVVSPHVAIELGKLGGLGVLNLEGIFTRYAQAERQLAKLAKPPKEPGPPGGDGS